ncbi:uncharacterized protein LOC111717266 [Eurytemora carolleeae]|uniref:uncharacterized protein LOC111717266 n=1 Tax=Eurytemora carolleeae TaxID=1294199 RepID=UPI000C780771|nr:uncharacterized protein LOC111717266 [Eurytemora carolleeae]|eukprot:XP_023348541.1 uncharacterized protein LOC111717266 [Eurytemora affinis]
MRGTSKFYFSCLLFSLSWMECIGIQCYTCGLDEVDPNLDQPDSYNTTVDPGRATGNKMYNESCYLMETKTGQNVPITLTAGEVEPYMKSVEELTAVVQFLKSANPKWDLETGFLIYEEEYIVMKAKLKSGGQPAIPEWDSWGELMFVNYDMSMWIRECTNVAHCYEAKGAYIEQIPSFRGCPGTNFEYDNTCFQEIQGAFFVN